MRVPQEQDLKQIRLKVLAASVLSDSLQSHGHSLPGSSVHGILQDRILEWIAVPFSGDLSDPEIESGSPKL